jgi:hypothetical protein
VPFSQFCMLAPHVYMYLQKVISFNGKNWLAAQYEVADMRRHAVQRRTMRRSLGMDVDFSSLACWPPIARQCRVTTLPWPRLVCHWLSSSC